MPKRMPKARIIQVDMDSEDEVIVNGAGPASSEALAKLQSKEQLDLLNAMDQLRTHGVSEYVSLPQLVVCGDQSAGKSSVLEAITEVPFPQSQQTCTRFATQIVLRRAIDAGAVITIIPASHRSDSEKATFVAFRRQFSDLNDLPKIIADAEKLILQSTDGKKAFAKDVLNVEISGPAQPHLTLVDLPGIIHTSTASGEEEDDDSEVEVVKELVKDYMKEERTIILAIVAGNYDYNNQIVLSLAKDFDPASNRTIGIITKPDMQPVGSVYETTLVNMACNKIKKLRLGWHVLKNRSFEEQGCSIMKRNEAEERFFSKGIWKSLPTSDVGVAALRKKLSNLLFDHIKKELPRVVRDIKVGLVEADQKLATLGPSRSTYKEQAAYLVEIADKFKSITTDALEGFYRGEFFDDVEASVSQKYSKRLRANATKLGAEFNERMHAKGHMKSIKWENEEETATPGGTVSASATSTVDPLEPEKVSYQDAIQWVKPILQQNRGRELRGTFNPLIIGTVFWHQSQKWNEMGQVYLEEVNLACKKFVKLALTKIAGKDMAETILSCCVSKILEDRYKNAKDELSKVISTVKEQPTTYNHYFTAEVQKMREQADVDSFKAIIHDAAVESNSSIAVDTKRLLNALVKVSVANREDDMDNHACAEVLQNMRAYYKVALKTYIDKLATDVVERHLLCGLADIFSPKAVYAMSEEQIARIAAESEHTRTTREETKAKREGLQKGLDICKMAMPGVEFHFKDEGAAEDEDA